MFGDRVQCFVAMGLLVVCLVLGQAGPGFSLTGEPAASIVLAAGPTKHVIKPGDTVSLLALRYGVSSSAILKANPGLNPSRLQLGKVVLIPTSAPAVAPAANEPAPAAPSGKTIELRPEKAPQATIPLTSTLRERDLVDTPANPTAAAPSAKEPQPSAVVPPATAPSQTRAEPSAPADSAASAVTKATPGTEAPTVRPGSAGSRIMAMTWPEAAGLALAVAVLLGCVWVLRGVLDNLTAGWGIRLLGLVKPGDVIRVAGCIGRVEHLGGLAVTVRTLDDEGLRVPNVLMTREVLVVLPPEAE